MKHFMIREDGMNQQMPVQQQPAPVQQQQQPPLAASHLSDEQIVSIFSTGEKVERTPRGATNNSVKKKKVKK